MTPVEFLRGNFKLASFAEVKLLEILKKHRKYSAENYKCKSIAYLFDNGHEIIRDDTPSLIVHMTQLTIIPNH